MPVPVRKAILPVGGLGTRFLPATKSLPKEMLPVVDKPLIQYAFEEGRAAGIEQFIFVTGRGKQAIEDHFDHAVELQDTLAGRGKSTALQLVRDSVPAPGQVCYTRQQDPLGLGHAVWCARHFIGDEPVAIILPDDLIIGEPGCLAPDGRGLPAERRNRDRGDGGPRRTGLELRHHHARPVTRQAGGGPRTGGETVRRHGAVPARGDRPLHRAGVAVRAPGRTGTRGGRRDPDHRRAGRARSAPGRSMPCCSRAGGSIAATGPAGSRPISPVPCSARTCGPRSRPCSQPTVERRVA